MRGGTYLQGWHAFSTATPDRSFPLILSLLYRPLLGLANRITNSCQQVANSILPFHYQALFHNAYHPCQHHQG